MNAFGLCSILSFPLFRSSCLFLTHFLSFPLFVTIHIVLVLGLLRALSIVRFICFWTALSFCRVYLFSWLRMLTLGFTCAESPSHAQLIQAELSSNGSSESRSESTSKLTSHQIPRCLRVPLQLKGCTRTSSLFSSTTPSGASVLCAFSTRSALHFDLGVEQACSAAARVLLANPSRTPPSSCSSCLGFLLYEASPHAEARRLRIHAPVGPLSLLRLPRHPS